MHFHFNRGSATISLLHDMAHAHPVSRDNNFPAAAKTWLQENIGLNLRISSFYRQLCDLQLINVQLHTRDQVNYWALVLAREQYVMDFNDQLRCSMLFLQQQHMVQKGFNVLFHVSNHYIRALAFTTPFFKIDNVCSAIFEIIIDSTFKTNAQRFELFVVHHNVGGYGVPIAYMYFCKATNDCSDNNDVTLTSRMAVVQHFCTLLFKVGVWPTFAIMDKDQDQICAVQAAWAGKVKIQLCIFHMQAVLRKLRCKLIKSSQYTNTIAAEAHERFSCIDREWFPHTQSPDDIVCPASYHSCVLSMMTKHANLHPLIPIGIGHFCTAEALHARCVKEMYDFCLRICCCYGVMFGVTGTMAYTEHK